MRHDFIDRYSRIDSPIHRRPTWIKVVLAISNVITVVAVPISYTLFFGIIGSLLLLIAQMSKIPKIFLLKRIILLEPFIMMIAMLSLFQVNGGIIFLSIVTKSTLCLFTMILLSNTTPFSELLDFLKRLRFSHLLITILALMYRYLFVLIDEKERMHRARESRSFKKSKVHVWKSKSAIIAQLFVRSTERAERIYSAMCARGWK